jgi:tRNA nucleotidyltransferase/poly(A) polymerase
MTRPSIDGLAPDLRALTVEVARRLQDAGQGAWIVGGSVRDLALGRVPGDVDMATDATPERIEALFPGSLGVGRAFGTMLVRDARGVIELTTFRSESVYSDSRRPDEVRFGVTLEEDAARRDFTCNALYLDPLRGELADPTGGLADLEAGRLRAVGDPVERLREDALRLVRMARFAGELSLEPDPDLLEATRANAGGLRVISGERVLAELAKILESRGSQRALELLWELGLLGARFASLGPDSERSSARRRASLQLPPAPGVVAGLAAIWLGGGVQEQGELQALHPSKTLRRGVECLWGPGARALQLGTRSALLRALVECGERPLVLYAGALAAVGELEQARVKELDRLCREVPDEQRRPAALIDSTDLETAGVERGPRWGALLRELEDQQLEGRIRDREAALDWLRARASERGAAD